jgi:hypothetical protein
MGYLKIISVILLLFGFGCNPIPKGGGPSPKEILIVSSETYSIKQLLASLNKADLELDSAIDKTKETEKIGENERLKFPYYSIAYWYPYEKSEYYGVALVKWAGKNEDKANKYFISVYSEKEQCTLCGSVKKALDQSQISYYSACEVEPIKTEYERFICGAF